MSEIETGYQLLGETRHAWFAKGPKGAVHVWASEHCEEFRQKWGEQYYGGIECHSPKPMYESDDGPHHEECWLLNGPCWHDGSSLQFSEEVEPMMRGVKDLHSLDEYMFSICKDRYRNWFDREAV